MTTIITDLTGYEPLKQNELYKINPTQGTIINRHNKLLGWDRGTGYKGICINNKPQYIHIIIYEHCNGPIKKGFVIDHIDNNKLNNSINNLQMITQSDNLKKDGHKKGDRRTKAEKITPIIAIDKETKEETPYASIYQASKALNMNAGIIKIILNGTTCKNAKNKTNGRFYTFRLQ